MTIPTDIPIKQITYNGTVVPIDTGGSVLDRTVTFKYNNEDYEVFSVNAGGSVPAPTTPTVPSGHTFSGWKTSASGGSAVSFPYTPASEDVTLYGSANTPAVGSVATVTGLGSQSPSAVTITKDADFPSSFDEWTDAIGNVFC